MGSSCSPLGSEVLLWRSWVKLGWDHSNGQVGTNGQLFHEDPTSPSLLTLPLVLFVLRYSKRVPPRTLALAPASAQSASAPDLSGLVPSYRSQRPPPQGSAKYELHPNLCLRCCFQGTSPRSVQGHMGGCSSHIRYRDLGES